MLTPEDPLKHEYKLNHEWAVTRMIQSYDSDAKLAYVNGYNAGIELLCAKAELSNPSIAEGVRELARKLAEETAKTLRSQIRKKRMITTVTSLYGK